MKFLVVLAVLGVCSASPQQAYNYGQPRYIGPVAAGVGGTVTPLSDTYQVASARDAFFRAYQAQLETINAVRLAKGVTNLLPTDVHRSAPAVHHSVPLGHPAGPVAYQSGLSYGVPGVVRDTPEVSAARAEFFRLYNLQAAAAAAAPDHHAHYDHH